MDKLAQDLAALLTAATSVGISSRGLRPVAVIVRFADDKEMLTFIPPEHMGAEWKPSGLQQRILDALKGKALRSEPLAEAVGVEKRSLYTERGVKELVARGLVGKDPMSGYYNREFPPVKFS